MASHAHTGSIARQRGMAAMMTMIFLLVVIGFAAVTLLRMSASDMTDSTAQSDSVAALFLAESGVERASYRLANGTACGNALMDAAPIVLGRGTLQVTNPAPAVVAGGRCRITVTGLVNATKRTVQVDLNYAITPISTTQTPNNSGPAIVFPPFAHNIPAASSGNRILIVGVAVRNSGAPPQTVTSVTYAGTPLSRIGQVQNGTNARAELWWQANPPTGNNPVVVTLSASGRAAAVAMSFSGVSQVAPVTVALAGTSSTPSQTVAVLANSWLVDVLAVQRNSPANPNAGQIGVSTQTNLGPGGAAVGDGVVAGGSRKGPSPAGNATMRWATANKPWAQVVATLLPVPVSIAAWSER